MAELVLGILAMLIGVGLGSGRRRDASDRDQLRSPWLSRDAGVPLERQGPSPDQLRARCRLPF
jgi:hypothetical protein